MILDFLLKLNKAINVERRLSRYSIDSNIENARNFIIENLKDEIEKASKNVGQKDYKTVLQEKLQIHGNVDIEYILVKSKGPDHDKTFVVEVKCNGKKLAERRRKNKKTCTNGSGKTCHSKN